MKAVATAHPRPLALALALALALTSPLSAQIWNADDRATITSFGEIDAISYDGRYVFAASSNGLIRYDPTFRRWHVPSTAEDGYPVLERAVRVIYDRSNAGLWLITASRNAFFRSDLSGSWRIRSPGEIPQDLLVAENPLPDDAAFNVMRATLSLDDNGRRWRLTAVAGGDREGTYFVGTAGGGIVVADTRDLSREWLSYGTLSRGVRAVAQAADNTIWFGGDGYGPRNGVTRTDRGLQNWRSYDSYGGAAPRGAVHRLYASDTIWSASDDGLHYLLPGARRWQAIDDRGGLSANRVFALAPTSRGIWAGSSRGLALLDPKTLKVISRLLDGVGVREIAERNDTLWVVSERGFFTVTGDRIEPVAALRARRVTSVAIANGSIFALADGQLMRYDSAWTNQPYRNVTNATLRGSSSSLLVLSPGAVDELRAATATWHSLASGDVPNTSITDAFRDGDYLWIATSAGAVRLRWP